MYQPGKASSTDKTIEIGQKQQIRLYKPAGLDYDEAEKGGEAMKKRLAALVLLACLLAGCVPASAQIYRIVDYSLFDTVTTIMTTEGKQSDFEKQAREILEDLGQYHRLFDIYQEYAGLVNLKTVNDRAGREPVAVEPRLMEFLVFCRQAYDLTEGRVNPAMGTVLQLWHRAREETKQPPDPEALNQAARHCTMEDVVLDPEAGTVFFQDPALQLDVGALAKGWAAERVAEKAPAGWLISVGGNVRATGPKLGEKPWIVGIQDPDDPGSYLQSFPLRRGSAVTSGDYQRYFTADGKRYHHLIDPDTCMPGELWRSVTVVTEDSGLADCLSTALFLLPYEEGLALLTKTGAEALWVDPQGKILKSPGFPQ